MDEKKALVVFEGKEIRRKWHKEEWWFVIVDVVKALTDSTNPRQYIKNMRKRDEELSKGWVQIEHPLLIDTAGGKQKVSCASTEGIFRIIQSIPSRNAEPFKRWLAKVGYERVQEIENPELAQNRMKELYKSKGYSDNWIEKRSRGIAIRDELTSEWGKRGVKTKKEFSILTAQISKATFGLTPGEYKKFKDLKQENLRDHMTDLELIFSMLGERVTTEITKNKNAIGFNENKSAAKEGGEVAGNARKDAEKRIGTSVISNENYLEEPEKRKKLGNKYADS
jgi:DNA-damage-inducible protein D